MKMGKKKYTTREDMDKFYEVNKKASYKNLLEKLTVYRGFRPYIMLHGLKFSLSSPVKEQYSKNISKKRYKMYFDFIPKDLKMSLIKLKKKIGKNYPVFFIAEAGVNHNGSLKLGKKLSM